MAHPTTSLAQIWADGAPGRRAWAEESYAGFLKQLSDWTRDSLPSTAETNIVLLGPTQVGKTTLLLRVLGIAAEREQDVAEILRGGQPVGHAATAAPMIYEYSESQIWKLNGKSLNDGELTKELKRIREDVENERGSTDCVRLAIPRQYFDMALRESAPVRILDLPGFNPANRNEGRHVDAAIKRYVPSANLILWLTVANELSKLNPVELRERSGAALDWISAPHRFCLITTYSFKLTSVKRDLLAKDHTLADMRSLLVTEMGVSGMNVREDMLYPLELGESWADTDQSFRIRVQPILDASWVALKARIKKAAEPLGKLRHARNVVEFAEKASQKRLSDCRAKQELLSIKLAKTEQRVKNLERYQRSANERLNELPNAETLRRACAFLCEIITIAVSQPENFPQEDDVDTRIAWFMKAVEKERKRMSFPSLFRVLNDAMDEPPQEAEELLKLMMDAAGTPRERLSSEALFLVSGGAQPLSESSDANSMRTILNAAFGDFEEHLQRYLGPWYWSKSSANFQKDRAAFFQCSLKSQKDVEKLLFAMLERARQSHGKFLSATIHKQNLKLRRIDKALAERRREKHDLEARRNALDEEKAKAQHDLAQDIQQASQFDAILRTALTVDLRRRRQEIAAEPAPARRFLRLLEIVKIREMSQDFISSQAPEAIK